jgi:hypothetical protein
MGGMFYYRNIGSAAAASFELVTDNFGNVNLSTPLNPESYDVPQFIRHNDTLNLFVGNRSGTIHYYKDLESNLFDGGIFTQISAGYAGINTGGFSAPFITQLTEDSAYFMFVGGDLGGLWNFKADPFSAPIIDDTLSLLNWSKESDWTVFPNPSTMGKFTLAVGASSPEIFMEVTDLLGRVVSSRKPVFGEAVIDLSNQHNGIYLVQLFSVSGNFLGSKKLIKQE